MFVRRCVVVLHFDHGETLPSVTDILTEYSSVWSYQITYLAEVSVLQDIQ